MSTFGAHEKLLQRDIIEKYVKEIICLESYYECRELIHLLKFTVLNLRELSKNDLCWTCKILPCVILCVVLNMTASNAASEAIIKCIFI